MGVKLVHLTKVGTKGNLFIVQPFVQSSGPGIDNELPGEGPGGIVDNELPSTPPPTPAEGQVLILVRSADGKWKYASLPTAGVPAPLPEPTPEPKNY